MNVILNFGQMHRLKIIEYFFQFEKTEKKTIVYDELCQVYVKRVSIENGKEKSPNV